MALTQLSTETLTGLLGPRPDRLGVDGRALDGVGAIREGWWSASTPSRPVRGLLGPRESDGASSPACTGDREFDPWSWQRRGRNRRQRGRRLPSSSVPPTGRSTLVAGDGCGDGLGPCLPALPDDG